MPTSEDHRAVHDDRVHGLGPSGVHQIAHHVGEGQQFRTLQRVDDYIRALADLERADAILQSARAGAGECGHLQPVLCEEVAAVLVAFARRQNGQIRLTKKIKVI